MLCEIWQPIVEERRLRFSSSVKFCGDDESSTRNIFEAVCGKRILNDQKNDQKLLTARVGGSGFLVCHSSSRPPSTKDKMIEVGLALESGTIVWCVKNPNRHDVLVRLKEAVDLAHMVSPFEEMKVLPNALVVVPIDWPIDSPKRAEQDVFEWLFKMEPTCDESNCRDLDALERNTMRVSITESFFSIDVFALPVVCSSQFKDRVDQLARSKWIAGCLEGWGLGASSQRVLTNCDDNILTRIERLFGALHSRRFLVHDDATTLWLEQKLLELIRIDFSEHCAARLNRLSIEACRHAHEVVLRKCRHLCGTLNREELLGPAEILLENRCCNPN